MGWRTEEMLAAVDEVLRIADLNWKVQNQPSDQGPGDRMMAVGRRIKQFDDLHISVEERSRLIVEALGAAIVTEMLLDIGDEQDPAPASR